MTKEAFMKRDDERCEEATTGNEERAQRRFKKRDEEMK